MMGTEEGVGKEGAFHSDSALCCKNYSVLFPIPWASIKSILHLFDKFSDDAMLAFDFMNKTIIVFHSNNRADYQVGAESN